MCKSCETSFSGSAIQLPRRKFLVLLGAALSTPLSLRAAAKGPPPKPQNVITADEAVNRLMIGNSRYERGTMRQHKFATQRAALTVGQNPFAGILSCAGSRVGPESLSIPISAISRLPRRRQFRQ